MKERKRRPVRLGDGYGTPSERKRVMKNSKQLDTTELELSWSNIQDQIASFLYATKKVPHDREITHIILDYPGGAIAADKVIPVRVIHKKGMEIVLFGDGTKL